MTTQKIKATRSDAYKISMAEAGYPIREEIFYQTHRRGGLNGWHYMPVDPAAWIKSLLPTPTTEDYAYLDTHGYSVGAAYRKAMDLRGKTVVKGVPKGSWFYNREPAFSVKGPSAVGSWLEPTSLMLHFRVQVATAILGGLPVPTSATCEAEKQIILDLYEELGRKAPEISVRSEEYYEAILGRGKAIIELLGDPSRAFEVGLRAVSCFEQHMIVLAALKEAGILRTSNVEGAQLTGMIPVGTMGHEHPQRMGSDYASFMAMKDRFPGFLSYLLDTYDTISSGIPAGLAVIGQDPDRPSGLRFDSEKNTVSQYFYAVAKSREVDLNPYLTLEGGWNYEKTVEFEKYRKLLEWPEKLQGYGYGGFFVRPPWDSFDRDTVAAVYKLCMTGGSPRMKFGDDPGSPKQSIPGDPVIWRYLPTAHYRRAGVVGIIAQEGEDMTIYGDMYRVDQSATLLLPPRTAGVLEYSPETQSIVHDLSIHRQEMIVQALESQSLVRSL